MILAAGLAVMKPAAINAEPLIRRAEATAYCLKGLTATETTPVEGRTVASKHEWLGKTMVIWFDDGDGQIKPENYYATLIIEDAGK